MNDESVYYRWNMGPQLGTIFWSFYDKPFYYRYFPYWRLDDE